MIKIVSILLLSCGLIACQQQEFQQCGGTGYTGSKTCATGLTCYKKDDYYSQCLKSCPSGWVCSTGTNTQAPVTQAPVTQAPVTQAPVSTTAKFPACNFRFGAAYLPNKPESEYVPLDYISIWVGTISSDFGTDFNKWYHGKMLEIAVKYKKIPLYYGYIIAFMARHMQNLQDCDVVLQGNNLCEKGANFIRNNRAAIVAKYKSYALETAKIIGRQSEMIWLIEPDFWQYTGKKQLNGGLDGAYMRKLFDDIALAIKSELPNARISWDISAWLTEAEMTTWWGFFASSPNIDFIHTSGGQSNPASLNIKGNELKWSFMSNLTKKKIIADTGYGVAGSSGGHTSAYDSLTNINARIKDGVIAVTQANARSDWGNILSSLRSSIPKLC